MNRELVLRLLDRSHGLISSARIEGTPVYNAARERLGTMHSVMIDKQDGRISYAVMLLEPQDDGLLHAHPLPWRMLHFDTGIGGYRVDLTRELLAKAPSLTLDETDDRLREILEQDCPAWVEAGEAGALPFPLEENDFQRPDRLTGPDLLIYKEPE